MLGYHLISQKPQERISSFEEWKNHVDRDFASGKRARALKRMQYVPLAFEDEYERISAQVSDLEAGYDILRNLGKRLPGSLGGSADRQINSMNQERIRNFQAQLDFLSTVLHGYRHQDQPWLVDKILQGIMDNDREVKAAAYELAHNVLHHVPTFSSGTLIHVAPLQNRLKARLSSPTLKQAIEKDSKTFERDWQHLPNQSIVIDPRTGKPSQSVSSEYIEPILRQLNGK